jgi:hypothetical protein
VSEYRKKPVVVEARQLIDDLRNHTEIATWITVNGGDVDVPFAEPCLYIKTPEGRMKAEIGDWIVRGVKGEFSTCDPITFEVTADPQDVCPSCGQRGGPYCEPNPYAKRVQHEAAGGHSPGCGCPDCCADACAERDASGPVYGGEA